MHVQPTLPAGTPDPSAARTRRLANRVAARTHRAPSSTYRTPSVLRLRVGPLHKLAWIFGLR